MDLFNRPTAVILSIDPRSSGLLLGAVVLGAFLWSWIANYLFTKYQ